MHSQPIFASEAGKEMDRRMVEGKAAVERNAWLGPLDVETKTEDPRVRGKRPDNVKIVSAACKIV